MCGLYMSFGSKIRPRSFGCAAMAGLPPKMDNGPPLLGAGGVDTIYIVFKR